jgi:DNA processing protein
MADLSERDSWITVAAVEGVGEERFGRLLERFGTARDVLAIVRSLSAQALARELRATFGRRPPDDVPIALVAAAADPLAVHRRLADLGVWTVTPLDDDYPVELHELADKPAVVYGQGQRELLHTSRRVAVVGTRRPTLAGRAFAAAVARRLVDCQAVVVSGLAMGIDGAAHAATVEAGGATIAVIGSGHAEPGPRTHARLAAAILSSGGAIIGELAPDAHATAGTFPKRNRIISALSAATIVIDAPTGSGALITARHALEQGRLVLVAPGRPNDPSVAGSLALLRETPARPLVGLDELVVDLGFDVEDVGSDGSAPGESSIGRPPPAHLSVEGALRMLGPAERLSRRACSVAPPAPMLS